LPHGAPRAHRARRLPDPRRRRDVAPVLLPVARRGLCATLTLHGPEHSRAYRPGHRGPAAAAQTPDRSFGLRAPARGPARGRSRARGRERGSHRWYRRVRLGTKGSRLEQASPRRLRPRPVTPVLLDTGVIVALLDRDERHHDACVFAVRDLGAELVTCEAVIA